MADRLGFNIWLNEPTYNPPLGAYGINVTPYADLNQVQPQITSALDEELDTFNVTLHAADAIAPVEWQKIYVWSQPFGTTGSERIFGGYIITVNKVASTDPTKNDYELGCSDFGAMLDKVYVKAEYEDYTDAQIITAVFASSSELSEFGVASFGVNSLMTFPRVRFNRKTVREILDWICTQTGGHWYMGYSQDLHYFGSEENSAPYDVTDDPADTTRKTVENVVVSLDGSAVVNMVEVVGGSKFSEDVTETYTPVGNTPYIDLSQRYKPPSTLTKIQVRRNDGGATTNLAKNPSFENNITDDWTQFQLGAGGAWVKEANGGGYGTQVLKMTAGTGWVGIYCGNTVLQPGESITASVKCWCAELALAGIAIYNVSNSAYLGTSYNQKKSTWERAVVTYKNTGTAAINVRVNLLNIGNDGARITYFDGVQFEKLGWASGYCDGTLGTGYAWTGTAHNSTSTRIDMPIWTTLAVKTGGSELLTSVDDVLYYESGSRLELQKNWPALNNSVEILGRYEIPMRTRASNQASYDHYGKWLQLVVSAPEIVDKEVGQMRAQAELAANAFANTAISYTTRESGLRAGMTQNVKLTARGLNSNYLIKRVTTTISIAGYVSSVVELGAVGKSLVWLLLALKRRSTPEIAWNDNEVLDELLDMQETIILTETVFAPVTSAPPYMWDEFRWNHGAWG